MNYKLFASESVAAGHPDKICDQTSDAILDAALKVDPLSRVAVECLVTKNRMVIAGEVTCLQDLPYEQIARSLIKDLGYTTTETPELMPLPIILAHRLVEKMDQARAKKIIPYLRPDGKSEVVVRYDQGTPKEVERVVLAVPHDPDIKPNQLKTDLLTHVVGPVLAKYKFTNNGHFVVNGTGQWIIGGPSSDTGATGRKIIV